MLSCIEELSKISDLNTLLGQIENKSLLKDIIVNASRKFELVKENKAPLYNNFSGNCIDYEAIFKEFNIEPNHKLIDSQKLCLADIFVKKIERCTSCIKESVEKIKDNSYTEEQKIILLAKIEYLRKVSNISAKHINDLNIVDILDTELSESKESLLNRITISDKNLNIVYNSIKTEKQLLISKPLFEKYKNSFDSLFKSEIEGNDILIKKEKTTDQQKEVLFGLKRLVAEINRKKNQSKSADLIETVKNKSSSQPLSFVERENLRR